jgi:hypothetical protein
VDPEEIANYYGPVCGEQHHDDDNVKNWETRAEDNTTPSTRPDDSTMPRRSRKRKIKNQKPQKEA